MQNKRGFVTIAAGDEKYYQLASNLLRSFRRKCTEECCFAIICDRENEWTEAFDDVIIMDKAYCSYLDKLFLYEYTPYSETIFVDADALFIGDPNILWSLFENEDDFSCFGRCLPPQSRDGWFAYDSLGEYKDCVDYNISMHGGVYYLRRSERCKEITTRAIQLTKEYHQFKFAHFSKPADEPVLALSMAISGAKPCSQKSAVLFLPSYEGRVKVDVDGDVYLDGRKSDAIVLHFATINTCRFIYKYLQNINETNVTSKDKYRCIKLGCLKNDIVIPNKRRLKRFVKYSILKRTKKNNSR